MRRVASPWPGIRAALRIVDDVLESPARHQYIDRADGRGALLWRCVVPAEYCKPNNAARYEPGWVAAKRRAKLFEFMLHQHGLRRRELPLPGRPMVRCVRFNSHEADPGADWAKMPIDLLQQRRVVTTNTKLGPKTKIYEGLGFIVNDTNQRLQRAIWWEYLPRNMAGIVLLEVYTGNE
jgi:hypothetical protein